MSIQNFGIIANIDMDISSKEGSLVFLNGRNGRGKTTFQSALRWCFFGDEPSPSKFVSSWSLNSCNIGDTLTARVEAEVLMDSAGTVAVIERTQMFQKIETAIPKRIGQAQLSVRVRKSTAGSLTEVQADPELWVQHYFPRRLVNFFLFDGEMMKNFFDLKVKGAVQDAVYEIAGVDRFEKIAGNLAEVEKSLNKKIAKLTGTKAENINIKLEAQQQVLTDMYLQYKSLKEDLDKKEIRLNEINLKLAGLEGQTAAADRLKELEKDELEFRNQRGNAELEFQSEILSSGSTSLMVEAFPEFMRQFAKAESEGWLPPPFEPSNIESLIENGKCVCGTPLTPGDELTKNLHSMIEKYRVSSGVGKLLMNVSRQVELVEQNLQQNWKLIQEKNSAIVEASKRLERVQKKKDELLEIMKGSDVSEIRLLVDEKRILEKDRDSLLITTSRIEGQSQAQTQKVELLRDELDKATKGNKDAESLHKEAAVARAISEAAGKIHQSAITQVRQRLQSSFTEKFSAVKKGKFRTEITEDFEVRTLNEFGEETELAEGEKMMKAYVFAIALREVINLGFPLVVDTPFGRLDSANRSELSKMLSQFLETEVSKSNRQAFFLMQDTEYTPYTKRYFENLKPIEAYLAKDEEFENLKSDLGYGIDPDWLLYEAWKDWAEGRIK